MSSLHNIMDLCRLCLVKEKVSVPIFDGEGDTRQIFVKIAACLPVKVERNDKLPKKICDTCLYKVENVYQFWNTTANSEKQLRQWLGEASKSEDSSSRATALETDQLMLKVESIDADQVSEHGKAVSHERDPLRRKSDEESASEDEDEGEGASSSEDTLTDCGDVCDGPSKEEADSEEDGYGELEPTTFVNVSMACEDQAGPSGLHQAEDEHAEITSELSNVDTLSTGQQDQSKPGTAPSTSEVVPVPSGTRTILLYAMNPDNTLQVALATPVILKPPQPKNPGMFTCELCLSKYDTQQGLIDHVDEFHGLKKEYPCLLCNKTFKKNKLLKSHMETHNEGRPYACDVCQQSFKRKQYLLNHKKIHTQRGAFKCEVCDYTTAHRIHLQSHQRRHFKQYVAKCSICDKGFHSKVEMRSHANAHTGERPFACKICGKAYFSKSNLHGHERSHVKTFPCDECDQAFAYKRSLLRHKMAHAGERHFLCDVCGKALTSEESLRMHRRTHTGERPFVCEACGKTFARRSNMRVHVRTHTGERPYQCPQCDKCFTQRSTLVIHMRYHSGERPYKCDICGKAFVSRSLLNSHLLSHGNGKNDPVPRDTT